MCKSSQASYRPVGAGAVRGIARRDAVRAGGVDALHARARDGASWRYGRIGSDGRTAGRLAVVFAGRILGCSG